MPSTGYTSDVSILDLAWLSLCCVYAGPLLMEVEVIEPDLYLGLYPGSESTLAAAILRKISSLTADARSSAP